ncbi:MAG: histidine kinase [Prosthecobacter sp.]|jgi:signal transduction histidine kinase
MDESIIPLSRVSTFVRRHVHDVRNGLNSLDLEMELLNDLAPEDEAMASVERMRRQLRTLAQQLRTLAAQFQEPTPVAVKIPASVLLKIWREKHADLKPSPLIQWEDELGEEQVNVDVEMMALAFRELLTNAMVHSPGGPLTITAQTLDAKVVFELREPKPAALDVTTWGQPFTSTRRERYGLGLWTVRRLMAASGVFFEQRYDPAEGCLLTQLVLAVV